MRDLDLLLQVLCQGGGYTLHVKPPVIFVVAAAILTGSYWFCLRLYPRHLSRAGAVEIHRAAAFDLSLPLAQLRTGTIAQTSGCDQASGCGESPDDPDRDEEEQQSASGGATGSHGDTVEAAGVAVEQTTQGTRDAAKLVESFDGLGNGFTGPQGSASTRNPSDNSLATGPDHIVQIVNSRMAVFTKKGKQYDTTGRVLYGPVVTNTIFAGFGGQCERQVSGDAVVRYDQLAGRWLYVLPVFRRPPGEPDGPYSMCYALSTGPDPLGPYHRYEFKRRLFPDYPRPAVWPDGYYIPTSTGDNVIEKHACVADRAKMLQGLPATEQCIVVGGANFLNNADIDGMGVPPPGAPNIIIAAGGTQLHEQFSDDGLYAWEFHTDWETPANTALTGPVKIPVAPYHYLCNGQLTSCVPQPGTDRRLDSQGDKLMQRLVYRKIGGRESIVGLHSINTKAGGGGVRWYELRLDQNRNPTLYQQGTYAPDEFYRWMGSMSMDHQGNIGIGYSFGSSQHFAGQRFAARLADDPKGALTLHETVLAEGAAPQTNTLRWEDYATTAMDPGDDCTFWYVGDYLKKGAASYSTRIGAFRIAECLRGTISGAVYFDRNHDGRRDAGEQGLAGLPVAYSGAQSGKLITDADGRFATSLPADPAYSDPTYTFAIQTPAAKSWEVTGRPARVSLKNGDQASGLDMGMVCTVKNQGGRDVRYWLSGRGTAVLKEHDGAWREMASSKFNLTVAAGADGYRQLHRWLGTHLTSVQGLITALNLEFGSQDGEVTVHDPRAGDWPTVRTLVQRVSEDLRSGAADGYRGLLEGLNKNSAYVTPAMASGCAARHD